MGRTNNIGVRASVALQTTQACLARIESPVGLAGMWGPFEGPKMRSNTPEMSQIIIRKIRLVGRQYIVDSVCDVNEDLTTLCTIHLKGSIYVLRFIGWVGYNNQMSVLPEAQNLAPDITSLQKEAQCIEDRLPGHLTEYAKLQPHAAGVIRHGHKDLRVFAAVIQDFRLHLKRCDDF